MFEIEVWPLPHLQEFTRSDVKVRQQLDALERLITMRAIENSQFSANIGVLSTGEACAVALLLDPPRPTRPLQAPSRALSRRDGLAVLLVTR